MKDSDREFQVEGDKNKILGTEPSLQAWECLENRKKTYVDEAWHGIGKSSELRTRFIRLSRYFILVEWETLGFKEWKRKIHSHVQTDRHTHTHTHTVFAHCQLGFPMSLLFTLSSIPRGPGLVRALLKHWSETCPFTSAIWPCFPGEVIHRFSKQGNAIKHFFLSFFFFKAFIY